jgi:hypothetical protein
MPSEGPVARRRTSSAKKRREAYDHDAHKAVPMDPLEGAMTFLYLMQQQAAIDVATGNDPLERWRVAKEQDRELERARRRAWKDASHAAGRSSRRR